MSSIVIIQSRLSSSRLPAKALLPVCSIPMVVLAAKRAANRGRKVIVATSDEKFDDCMQDILNKHGIRCYRGDLDNTLKRFVSALSDLSDDARVMRLTADNLFPDGDFLNDVEDEFLQRGLQYLSTTGNETGLPYGVSVEVTRLQHLRDALRNTTSQFDLEHVTPYVVRKFGLSLLKRYAHLSMGHFRATVDNLDDYLCVSSVFSQSTDPVAEPWNVLVERLRNGHFQPQIHQPAVKMVLETKPSGTEHGAANTSRLDISGQIDLIRTGIANGVQYLDTAKGYGRNEEVVGKALGAGWSSRAEVVTKLSSLEECPFDMSEQGVRYAVESSIYQSCTNLKTVRLDTVLLHRASHFTDWHGAVWQRLKQFRDEGRIGALGVVVQTPGELLTALQEEAVTHIQLPCNILDNRWHAHVRAIEQVKRERTLIIHARNVLLQGILTSRDPKLWNNAHITDPAYLFKWSENLVQKFGRDGITDLCIAYMNGLSWIDGIVLSAGNGGQLMKNLQYMSSPPLSGAEVSTLIETQPEISEETLNLSLWKAAT